MSTGHRLLLLLVLTATAAGLVPSSDFHPHYSPPIAHSIQRWGISTLREQIHAGHIAKVAIYDDGSSVEVLDTNGLQRRVDIFPGVTDVLVQDLREEHVDFFVAPVRPPAAPLLIAMAQAFIATMCLLAVINILGMTDMLFLGMMFLGYSLVQSLEYLGALLTDASAELDSIMNNGKQRHDDAIKALVDRMNGREPSTGMVQQGEPIPIFVEERNEEDLDQ